MKTTSQPGLAILLAGSFFVSVLFTSCTSMLSAKFESDTIGSLPDKTLPGNPTGDAMTYVPEIETQLEVIATPANPAQKSLEYKSVSPSGSVGGHSSWLGFRAKSTNFSKAITFVWSAKKEFNTTGPDLYIDCSDGSGVVAARIKILANGDVKLVENIATDDGTLVGTIPNGEVHTFMVTVDLPNEKYNLSVLKTSGNITITDHALLNENITLYHNPANPAVSFKYDTYGIAQQYILDEVFINRKN
ncbi:MAG: hypothetical protein IPM71_10970 [Bacteroidota bacterium]|nr:MAG: hypothetical protein IPM71_10970 [Bacteroidota bacterium]